MGQIVSSFIMKNEIGVISPVGNCMSRSMASSMILPNDPSKSCNWRGGIEYTLRLRREVKGLSIKQSEEPESRREWMSRLGIGWALNEIKHPSESFLERADALSQRIGTQSRSTQSSGCASEGLLSIFSSPTNQHLRLEWHVLSP